MLKSKLFRYVVDKPKILDSTKKWLINAFVAKSSLLSHVSTYEAYLPCIASSKQGDKRQRLTIHHTVSSINVIYLSATVKYS